MRRGPRNGPALLSFLPTFIGLDLAPGHGRVAGGRRLPWGRRASPSPTRNESLSCERRPVSAEFSAQLSTAFSKTCGLRPPGRLPKPDDPAGIAASGRRWRRPRCHLRNEAVEDEPGLVNPDGSAGWCKAPGMPAHSDEQAGKTPSLPGEASALHPTVTPHLLRNGHTPERAWRTFQLPSPTRNVSEAGSPTHHSPCSPSPAPTSCPRLRAPHSPLQSPNSQLPTPNSPLQKAPCSSSWSMSM
jgi:hypothetical protein